MKQRMNRTVFDVLAHVPGPALQLKITLRTIRPPIWRRIVLPANANLGTVHAVIQSVMGWHDSHLHAFRKGRLTWGDPEHFEYDPLVRDEARTALAELGRAKGARFVYEYDFGDGWLHDVVVEAAVPDYEGTIVCLAGRRECPPEDCGGPYGYMDLLRKRSNQDDPEHDEAMLWTGRMDPEWFSVEECNARLQSWLTPRPAKAGASARSKKPVCRKSASSEE